MFLEGKYSKFDPAFKTRILRFHNSGKESTLGHILYRTPARKKQLENALMLDFKLDENAELYSILNIEEETYDPKIYNI
jgi:hypothetical protein